MSNESRKNISADEFALDLLSRMTLREKVGQLNQRLYGFRLYERRDDEIAFTSELDEELERWGGLGILYGLYRADPWSERTAETGISPRLALSTYNKLQAKVIKASRFGIPALMSSECPHGHQALDGYLLPVPLAMGSTFSPELVREAFGIVGSELCSMGVDLALMSVLDVLRDPRWGRSEECFGEDPLLCAVMADAAVSGCVKSGVDVVAKHFCAQGETTGGLNASPANIGMRELREIHLPPVRAAIEAGAVGIMAAYNEIDGIPCHANPGLLKTILREDLRFDGIVMADGTAIDRLDQLTGDNTASGALALKSGIDVSLWDEGFAKLEEAVNQGLVEISAVDQAVLRVLRLKFERGLFDKAKHPTSNAKSREKYPQSLELARHCPILLKNEENLLPLDTRPLKIAIIGPAADDIYLQLGDYTPPVEPETVTTLRRGLCQEAPEGIALSYALGCPLCSDDANQAQAQSEIEKAIELAKGSDLVILALGGSSSRFRGAKFDTNGAVLHEGDLYMDCGEGVDSAELKLPGRQHDLAREIYATGVKTITVIIAGRPYAIPDIAANTNALLYTFYPGPWGGKALAELIFGKTDPSGRLPATLPRTAVGLPCYYNKKAFSDSPRYSDIFSSSLYTFGYGMSYTSFEITDPIAKREKDGSLFVMFDIQNKGTRDGHAVPMLFIRWLRGEIVPREKELKAFTKVLLKPGESRKITLSANAEQMKRSGADMKLKHSDDPLLVMIEEGGTELWSANAVCDRSG